MFTFGTGYNLVYEGPEPGHLQVTIYLYHNHFHLSKLKDIERPSHVLAVTPTKCIITFFWYKCYKIYIFWKIIKMRFGSLHFHLSFDQFVDSNYPTWSSHFMKYLNFFIFAHKDLICSKLIQQSFCIIFSLE